VLRHHVLERAENRAFLGQWPGTLLREGAQRLAFDQLHDQVVNRLLLPVGLRGAHIVQRADVRVIERRDRLGLALGSLEKLAPFSMIEGFAPGTRAMEFICNAETTTPGDKHLCDRGT
jgi:hypothetical protein